MSTTLAVLLTVYFFLFAFLAWRRPLAALCLITAFLPSYLIRFNVMGIPMTMLEGMILILITVIIIKKLQIANCRLQIADLNPRFAICNSDRPPPPCRHSLYVYRAGSSRRRGDLEGLLY